VTGQSQVAGPGPYNNQRMEENELTTGPGSLGAGR
jgi:hypothetical protein